MRINLLLLILCASLYSFGQLQWKNVDSLYQPLPASLHVFYTEQKLDSAPFKAYYLIADLKDKKLSFFTDTTENRRLTPTQFYQKNENPLVVVNGTFFSFQTNRNLNVVINNGKLLAHNAKTMRVPSDTAKMVALYSSAIGLTKKRKADVAWIKTDSAQNYALALQEPYTPFGNFYSPQRSAVKQTELPFKKWKMQTAIGGGPVLMQNGKIKITNNEERMFAGKAANDKHPRTAMGYTAGGKLIILVVEGRSAKSGGATLPQLAQILKDLGCVEALNLDGGGSSCLLVNGKETIKPSDAIGQRAVPAVFMIKGKN